jgi:hypothetical protein
MTPTYLGPDINMSGRCCGAFDHMKWCEESGTEVLKVDDMSAIESAFINSIISQDLYQRDVLRSAKAAICTIKPCAPQDTIVKRITYSISEPAISVSRPLFYTKKDTFFALLSRQPLDRII